MSAEGVCLRPQFHKEDKVCHIAVELSISLQQQRVLQRPRVVHGKVQLLAL